MPNATSVDHSHECWRCSTKPAPIRWGSHRMLYRWVRGLAEARVMDRHFIVAFQEGVGWFPTFVLVLVCC